MGWPRRRPRVPGADAARRLPMDLRQGPGPEFDALPFTPLYLTDDEFAAELANRTMHGVMHIGRVADRAGGYHAQMAVLVKPNGLPGNAYMAAIKPFRHLIVYPALLRETQERWERDQFDRTTRPRRLTSGSATVRRCPNVNTKSRIRVVCG